MALSIITINKDNAIGLEKTCLSVITQTWTDYEWIIIDGGSTDRSVDVIKEYAKKNDKLVYWCSEPDGGIYQAMNKGIDIANGEWLNFMNSGDSFYSESVLQNIFETENIDADIIYGDALHIYSFGSFVLKAQSINYIKKEMPFVHQASFVKTEIIKKNKFNETFKIGGDYHFFYNCYINNKKFIHYPLVVSVFDNDHGISSNNYLLQCYEYARIKGIENKLAWKMEYKFCCFRFLLRKILPKFVVEKIRLCIYLMQKITR